MAPKESDPLDTPTILSEEDDGSFLSHESVTGLLKTWQDEDVIVDTSLIISHDEYDSSTRLIDEKNDDDRPPTPTGVTSLAPLTEKDFYDALPPLNQPEDVPSEASIQETSQTRPTCLFLNFRGSRLLNDKNIVFQDVCVDLEKEVSYESVSSLYYDSYGAFAPRSLPPPRKQTKPKPRRPFPPPPPPSRSSSRKPSRRPAVLSHEQQKKRMRQAIDRQYPLPSIRIDNDVVKHLAGKLDRLKRDLTDTRWKMKMHEEKEKQSDKKRRVSISLEEQGSSKKAKTKEVEGIKRQL